MKKHIAIRANHLSKKYPLGQHDPYRTFAETVTNMAKAPFRSLNNRGNIGGTGGSIPNLASKSGSGEFWALKDVSFEVGEGEIVGIIGRNGAGKSTLLKILSRITSPTEGEVELHGRVGSLLEVGTGFHPELTGRENIFLSGSLLGMKKQEIEDRFDEIVKFAEIGQFLDTPVKKYSSGMYVRLGFAVAAHLEPEILLIDEVLAVGDAAFQKKCLGKMGDVAKEGRTVLFVSHNMWAVSSLCSRGIFLKNGQIFYSGTAKDTIEHYDESILISQASDELVKTGQGSGGIIIKRVWLSNQFDQETHKITSKEPVFLNMDSEVQIPYQDGKKISVGFAIDTFEGRRLLTCVSLWKKYDIITNGTNLKVQCFLPLIPFVPGKYSITVAVIYNNDTLIHFDRCYFFEIQQDFASLITNRTKDQGDIDIEYSFTYYW